MINMKSVTQTLKTQEGPSEMDRQVLTGYFVQVENWSISSTGYLQGILRFLQLNSISTMQEQVSSNINCPEPVDQFEELKKTLSAVESDVKDLRRNIAMLNRLLKEKTLKEAELEVILRRLRNATGAAEIGEVGYAAEEVEQLIGDLVVDSAVALNPFLFRNFWMGVDTRWPAGGETGVMIIRICNDGTRPMPEMRLAPPVPDGWQCAPESIDLPIMRPGDVILVRFEVKPGLRFSLDEIPLSRKIAIQTGYEIAAGQVMVTMRVQNRSMETIRDLMLQPWLPPGYKAESIPLVEKLSPDEIGVISMSLTIDLGDGGENDA